MISITCTKEDCPNKDVKFALIYAVSQIECGGCGTVYTAETITEE
jgi:ribosomal protein S27E